MHPNAKISYRASVMILNVLSDASYLSAPKSHSHADGYFFLCSVLQDTELIFINGATLITWTILKLVAALATEAELRALFLNAEEANIIQLVLKELGHLQPRTPIHINNTTTVGKVNNTIKQQRSWAMEMQYFWLLNSKVQKLFCFHYQPGKENLGDYPLKHHSANIHQHACPYYDYVRMNNSPTVLSQAAKPSSRQGCVETLADPYNGKIPLARINAFQEPFASHQVIQQDTPNIRRANQYLKHTETCMKYAFPPIATE